MTETRREFLETDLTPWVIGPFHAALPGQMRLHLMLDGEVVASGRIETGFLHRGLEKAFEMHSWHAAVAYADRLDPDGAVFGELALCQAVEELGEISVPLRAQAIRVILCELARISCHLGYAVKVSRAVGAETMTHYVLRDREKVLDLFELLTGARFSINFLRYGGVVADVTEGFIERVLDVCDLIRLRLKEYNDLFTFNHAFLKRTAFIGVITADHVRRLGITGPNARASGVSEDTRKSYPYSGYQNLDFEVPSGRGEGGTAGDAHDRFLVRLREIHQSVEILRQVCENLPDGDFSSLRFAKDFRVPPGEAYARVESSRGLLACHVVSDGSAKPARVQFRVPSLGNLMALQELIPGSRVEDLPAIIGSLDIGVAEVDR